MKRISRQYVMSVYDDGSVRVTERALTKHDKANGRYTGNGDVQKDCVRDGFQRFFVLAKPIG